jgi:homoserine O-acetyltransferase
MLAAPLATAAVAAQAQPERTPREGVWIARDVRFDEGARLDAVRLGWTTLGDPAAPAVLLLHGTTGSARNLTAPGFADALFGPGQPLDAARHFLILPDALGHGRSSKPSDGMGPDFPRYTTADMVRLQHRLVTEGLNVARLRLVLGNSMGGMHTWNWACTYPEMMAAAVPMAALPSAMSGRNWMLRRLMVEMIRRDPAYQGGRYTAQPASLGMANVFFATATNGGNLALQAAAPSRAAGDALVAQRLAAPPPPDANDFIWQWESTRDYDPGPHLGRIRARVLAINSADDERNPPELGLLDAAIARIPNARAHIIPASAETPGHGTTGQSRFWAGELARFLATVP